MIPYNVRHLILYETLVLRSFFLRLLQSKGV